MEFGEHRVNSCGIDGAEFLCRSLSASNTPRVVNLLCIDHVARSSPATDNGGFIIERSTRVDFQQRGTNGPIGDTTPELSGTGEPGASVAVTIDGTLVGTAKVPDALADGLRTHANAQTSLDHPTSDRGAREQDEARANARRFRTEPVIRRDQ